MRVLIIAMFIGLISWPVAADDPGLSYANFVEGVSLEKNTSLGAKTFWQNHRNSTVSWSATVVEVKGSRGGAEIRLAKSGYPLHRGYNIVLVVGDRNSAGTLKKGDVLCFRGQLSRYRARPGHPIVVYLYNGQLLDATTTVSAPASGNPQADFAAFATMLSSTKNTKIGAQANWESLKIHVVNWKATVVDVKGGRHAADVYLAAPNAPLYRGYNIILDNMDLGKASLLKKGQVVLVQGTPAKYTYRSGNPVVVTLRYGDILTQ